MKYLRKFNENTSDTYVNSIVDFLQSTYDAEVSVRGNEIEVEKCDIEPEHGSYVDKTYISIRLDNDFKVTISGVSGQYGSAEPDEYDEEESAFEPEFDWQMGSSKIKASATLNNIDDVKAFIKEELDDYIS